MMWLSRTRIRCKAEKEPYSEGLIIASDNIDEVIALIKSSSTEEARGN
jgi:DNA gyrase/topoisomerase IV subunit A